MGKMQRIKSYHCMPACKIFRNFPVGTGRHWGNVSLILGIRLCMYVCSFSSSASSHFFSLAALFPLFIWTAVAKMLQPSRKFKDLCFSVMRLFVMFSHFYLKLPWWFRSSFMSFIRRIHQGFFVRHYKVLFQFSKQILIA